MVWAHNLSRPHAPMWEHRSGLNETSRVRKGKRVPNSNPKIFVRQTCRTMLANEFLRAHRAKYPCDEFLSLSRGQKSFSEL